MPKKPGRERARKSLSEIGDEIELDVTAFYKQVQIPEERRGLEGSTRLT